MATLDSLRPSAGDPGVQVIRPSSGFSGFNLGELWRYRELLLVLTWRTILVRYKQTAFGVGWALLQPLLLMLVFILVFKQAAKIDSEGVPYPIFAYAGLLPWMLFATSLTQASQSLVSNSNLLTKIYFPRLALPLSAVLASLVDFVVAFLLLIAMMVYYGVYPDPLALVTVPALLVLAFVTALGVGLWLAALNVKYRDVRHGVPFLTLLWLFATPVAYPASVFGEPWRTIIGLNPMAGVVEGFRWALLGAGSSPGGVVAISAAAALVLLLVGATYFRFAERNFADVV